MRKPTHAQGVGLRLAPPEQAEFTCAKDGLDARLYTKVAAELGQVLLYCAA